LQSQPDDDDDKLISDEITPEDGIFRYWVYTNGEGARMFAGLTAAFCIVAWCFLYVLGYGTTLAGIVLLIVAALGFVLWLGINDELKRYQATNWKKDRRSPKTEKVELRVAIALWLFILLAVSVLLIWEHHHEHGGQL
jgi:hypothetical protein